MEINPVLSDILYKVLEESVCKTLTLTGINVSPSELRTCHRLKRKDPVRDNANYILAQNWTILIIANLFPEQF